MLVVAGRKEGRLEAQTRPELVYVASLQGAGRANIAGALRRLSSEYGISSWAELRYEHVQAIRTALTERGLSASTVNFNLAAIRGVSKQAWLLGKMSIEDYSRIREVKNVRGNAQPGRALSSGEVKALFETCIADSSPAGTRDGAVLALLYAAGLRRAEAAGLMINSIEWREDDVVIHVQGKGAKWRDVHLNNGALEWLKAWFAVRGEEEGPLIWSYKRGGRTLNRKAISAQGIYDLMAKRCMEAGISGASPHCVRRSHASDLLDAGVDLATVSRDLGHSSPATSMRYDRRGDRALAQAARVLHVPFRFRANNSHD